MRPIQELLTSQVEIIHSESDSSVDTQALCVCEVKNSHLQHSTKIQAQPEITHLNNELVYKQKILL